MELPGPARPRISRETRLLLATILISIAALWTLARIRFPERPATPNPVPPLLTQLAAPPAFDDLASEVSKIESRLLPSLAVVELSPSSFAAALRVSDDVGAIWLETEAGQVGARSDGRTLLARDPASGLAIVTIPGAPTPELATWSPQRSDRPRYLVASEVSHQGPSLRPVFIGRLHPSAHAAWPGDIWMLPARTDVAPGDFLFTVDGALAGLVIANAGMPALVPADTLLLGIDRLRREKATAPGWLGVEVQALTPSLASATGAPAGVIVVTVSPAGPAAERLAVMDVIEAAGGEPIAGPDDWRVRVARLVPGQSIALRIRRRGKTMDVPLTVAAPPSSTSPSTLGLALRTLDGVGAGVVQVADGSAGARAGIRADDVIVAIGEIQAPTARQVAQAFAGTPDDRPLLVAVTRGNAHHVLVLDKK